MKVISRVIFTILVLLLALPAPDMATAKDSKQRQTSAVTGSVIEFDSSHGAAFEPDYYILTDRGWGTQEESIYIVTDMGQVVITFGTGSQTPDSFVQESVSSAPGWYSDYVDILGYDSTDESGWFFFRGTSRNNFHDYSYGEVNVGNEPGSVTAVYIYARDEDSTISLLSWTEKNLSIDGEHVFTSTDFPALEAMMDGTSEIEPERVYGFASEIEDWEDLGLVSDSKWISPIRGVEVEWNTDNLYFPTQRDDSILIDPEISDEYLYLYSQNPDGMISIAIENALPHDSNVSVPDHYEDYYSSPEWLSEGNYDQPLHGSRQSETAVSVIYSYTGSIGQNRVYIRTVWEPVPGVMFVFDVTNHLDLIAETYVNVIDSVTFDGEPVEALWSYEELAALFPPSNEVAEESETDVSDARSLIDDIHVWTHQD